MTLALRRIAGSALATPVWAPDLMMFSRDGVSNISSLRPFASLTSIWGSIFKSSEIQALKDTVSQANAQREADSKKLELLHKKVAFLCRRNEKLSEQLGFLNEVAIRQAVGRIHGEEAAQQAHVHSLQGLCALLISKDVPSRKREAELAARQSALVDAVASPDCFTIFVRLFLGRLSTYNEGNRGALSYIKKAQTGLQDVSAHLGNRAGLNRGRVIEAAITQIQTLEAVVTQDSHRSGSDVDETGDLEVDDLDLEDVQNIPPAYWAGRFFQGLVKYLRAAKGGLIKLRAHLAQPDSLGIALLAAASSQLLCAQFELDGRGSLEVFPDAAVITVFEYKSSSSGFAKGKRQLAARLQMLMWAARESGAVPSGVPVTGRGHLYLPGYARMRPQDFALDGGSMTISITSI